MYHWKPELNDIYFNTERKSTLSLFWKVGDLVECTPQVNHLLFADPWGGCNTTSTMCNKGKVKTLRQLSLNEVQMIDDCFENINSSQDDIGEAGCKFPVISYNGKAEIHRHHLEQQDVLLWKRAIYYHSLRVHLQIIQWKTLDIHCSNPSEWV